MDNNNEPLQNEAVNTQPMQPEQPKQSMQPEMSDYAQPM